MNFDMEMFPTLTKFLPGKWIILAAYFCSDAVELHQ